MKRWNLSRPLASITVALLLCMSLAALPDALVQAADLDPALNDASVVPTPDKPQLSSLPVCKGARQGGDTIEEAMPIDGLPYVDPGNTCQANDDMDVECPWPSTSADVFYSLTLDTDMQVTIDLCNSAYDTKLFVLDAELNMIACNDDFYDISDPCGGFVSKIAGLFIPGGETVYIGVDGYGGGCGAYLIRVTEFVPCEFDCPPGAIAEAEPPLAPDQADDYNGGCWSDPPIFQDLWGDDYGNVDVCATSGWFLSAGDISRDSDWFRVYLGPAGLMEFTMMTDGFGDVGTWMNIILPGPVDPCTDSELVEWAAVGPCTPMTFSYAGTPESEVWIVTAPVQWLYFEAQEYEYYLSVTGLIPIGTEATSWTSLKALYR